MITVEACAKVNLYLEVGRRRADGYHEIKTVFHSISLADQITLEVADQIEVLCDNPEIPSGPLNLAFRAAGAMARRFDISSGARITISKHIPSQAGLGGGSSDAAAVLVGLNRLWRIDAPLQELEALGASLGADVPFCVRGGAAFAEGIGEQLTQLPPLPESWLVIIKPEVAISTREAYAALDATERLEAPGPAAALAAMKNDRIEELAPALYNDFQPGALSRYPEVRQAFHELRGAATPAVLLCGSGSALFGLLDSESAAVAAVRRLHSAGWNAWPARFVPEGLVLER